MAAAVESVLSQTLTKASTVYNEQTDVATSFDKWQMRVTAPERYLHQYLYLWTATNPGDAADGSGDYTQASPAGKSSRTAKLSTAQYTAAEDGPEALAGDRLAKGLSLYPTTEELTKIKNTQKYLVIGLVVGNEPDRYLNTKAKGETLVDYKKRRDRDSPLDRDSSAIRAVVPCDEFLLKQCKVYVAIKPDSNRHVPKLSRLSHVFVFPEFFEGVGNKMSKKDRMRKVVSNIQKHALGIQTQQNGATVEPVRQTLGQIAEPSSVPPVAGAEQYGGDDSEPLSDAQIDAAFATLAELKRKRPEVYKEKMDALLDGERAVKSTERDDDRAEGDGVVEG
ncbi:hypothetical protein EJ03DRAFT_333143 [Teratosphaeria nubilosa]|uniref:Uncharacterized protein n=1 Tax=Teratosphaeria nubilosa TaxID=161662 RepID=A0A6G1LN65_9PEZI|nr:hypothetical protein EJ03DRAFT_333143 [Teratosphaeria nubilosa]